MNLEQAVLVIANTHDNELPVKALEEIKANWSVFYPDLERLMDQFIAEDTSLTDGQNSILFFGTLLLAELKYSPALSKCLQLFSCSDSFLMPIEIVFGDAITELTPTLFYNVANGNTQALSDYIIDNHQAMYCKAAAMEAVFAQYEMGTIDKAELSECVERWLSSFLAISSSINGYLISALADYCIEHQLDNFKTKFLSLCDQNIFDEQRFTQREVKAWHKLNPLSLIESGIVQTEFDLVETLQSWIDDEEEEDNLSKLFGLNDDLPYDNDDDLDIFEELMGEGGLLSNLMYDEQTILENSVPVSSLVQAGRNDPCPCGSGKKYKKCCLK